jgi:hypothetical protein
MEQSFMGIHTKACQQANHLLTGENWFSRIGGMQENLTKNNVENYIYKKKLKKEKLMYSKKNFTIYWNSKLSKKIALRNYLYKLYRIRLVILFYITQ